MRSQIARLTLAWKLAPLLLLLGLKPAMLSAQVVEYLKPIGGTDIELYFHLEVLPTASALRHEGEKIQVAADGATVVYTLARGRVAHVSYQKLYPLKKLGESDLQKARQFMVSSGIEIKDIREATGRVVANGEGNGFHGILLLVPTNGNSYRLDAEIFAHRE